MNDFTKAELEELLISLSCRFSRQLGIMDRDHLQFIHNLEHKIQSMIDNYCEHSEHHYYGDIAAVECKQCHMVMLP